MTEVGNSRVKCVTGVWFICAVEKVIVKKRKNTSKRK